MPKARFKGIYIDLRRNIRSGHYPYESFLPSENELVRVYSCSRNTVRRAIGKLADEGYVQPLHGKGVRVIWRASVRDVIGSIEGLQSFNEYAAQNNLTPVTKVITFEHIACGRGLSAYTGFDEGEELIHIVRVRSLDGFACGIAHNYLLAKVTPSLTPAIAEDSIYHYVEHDLGMRILMSKRQFTVELASEEDKRYLQMGPYDCMAVVENQAFDSEGEMFEFTQARIHPDVFRYCTIERH